MKILILTRYGRLGASSRYRFFDLLPYFDKANHKTTVQSLFDDAYVASIGKKQRFKAIRYAKAFYRRILTLGKARGFDALILEKEVFPYLPRWIEAYFRFIRLPYIVDYDDAIFHQYDQHRSKVVRYFLADKIAKIMRTSALVTTGNNYLANFAVRAGSPCVKVVPTTIQIEHYPRKQYRDKKEIFTIVWIGSPSTTRYLNDIAQALQKLCANGKARLRLIGAAEIDLPNVDYESFPWSEETEINLIREAHVGIMPLPDTPWERGKCGFKLIQYMGCHLPVVGSPVGVNTDIIDQGVNGFLADTIEEWVTALETLQSHPDQALIMGLAGRRKVEESFSLEAWGPKYISMIESILAAAKEQPVASSLDTSLQTERKI